MSKLRRFLPVTGAALGGLAAAVLLPMAVGHADDAYETCEGGVCLVQTPGYEEAGDYTGLRPFVTDWNWTQPYSLQTDGADGNSADLGSYNISTEDVWTPVSMLSHYQYGDLTLNDGVSDSDLGAFADQSGASIWDISYFGGLIDALAMSNVDQHGHELSYYVTTVAGFTNTLAYDPINGTTADYIQVGDSDPQFLFNGFFHGDIMPQVPDYLIPGDQFSDVDFDPGQFIDQLTDGSFF
jgi:hypothetical protein